MDVGFVVVRYCRSKADWIAALSAAFLVGQEEAELEGERVDGNRDDVVATDDTVVVEPVGRTDRRLG